MPASVPDRHASFRRMVNWLATLVKLAGETDQGDGEAWSAGWQTQSRQLRPQAPPRHHIRHHPAHCDGVARDRLAQIIHALDAHARYRLGVAAAIPQRHRAATDLDPLRAESPSRPARSISASSANVMHPRSLRKIHLFNFGSASTPRHQCPVGRVPIADAMGSTTSPGDWPRSG